MRFDRLLIDWDEEEFDRFRREVLEGTRFTNLEKHRLRDGEMLTMSISGAGIDVGGQGPQIMLAAEDVTEHKRALEEIEGYRSRLEELVEARTGQLTELNEELKRAMTTKTRFLASMSHELRTPLNSIVGFSSVLLDDEDGGLTDEQRRQVALVNEAGRRLGALVDEILDVSRLEAGRVQVHPAAFDLHAAVRFVEGLIAPQAADRGLELDVRLPVSDHPLHTDREKVQAILTNLLANAVKFTEEGSVTLEASIDGDEVVFEVRDTGIGIGEEDLPHVFEEFHRLPRSIRHTVGTGLGLAIARGYAELLGGTISVESTVGEGSTFRVVLPVRYSVETGAA